MTPEALRHAADENLVVHATAATRRLPGARVQLDPDLVLVDSGLPCDTFNFTCRARLDGRTASVRVRQAVDFFTGTGHPFSWWLGPGYSPPNLPERLIDAGLEPEETELALALDLSTFAPGPLPPTLEIVRVSSPAQLEAYGHISAGNWDPPDRDVLRYYRLAATALLDGDSRQWLYLGFLEGRPVATAELTIGGGVAGLYGISTIPEARGRGIGTAMTAAPLADARAAGGDTAVLQAAPAGVGVYRRLGFSAFGEIIEFKPSSAKNAR